MPNHLKRNLKCAGISLLYTMALMCAEYLLIFMIVLVFSSAHMPDTLLYFKYSTLGAILGVGIGFSILTIMNVLRERKLKAKMNERKQGGRE